MSTYKTSDSTFNDTTVAHTAQVRTIAMLEMLIKKVSKYQNGELPSIMILLKSFEKISRQMSIILTFFNHGADRQTRSSVTGLVIGRKNRIA